MDKVNGSGQKAIKMIKQGKVRNHQLNYNSPAYNGEISEKELQLFLDFLPTKNFYNILNLRGHC